MRPCCAFALIRVSGRVEKASHGTPDEALPPGAMKCSGRFDTRSRCDRGPKPGGTVGSMAVGHLDDRPYRGSTWERIVLPPMGREWVAPSQLSVARWGDGSQLALVVYARDDTMAGGWPPLWRMPTAPQLTDLFDTSLHIPIADDATVPVPGDWLASNGIDATGAHRVIGWGDDVLVGVLAEESALAIDPSSPTASGDDWDWTGGL